MSIKISIKSDELDNEYAAVNFKAVIEFIANDAEALQRMKLDLMEHIADIDSRLFKMGRNTKF